MCICMFCVPMGLSSCTCMWKPEVDVRNHFFHFLLIEASSLNQTQSSLFASLVLRIPFLSSEAGVPIELPDALSIWSGIWGSKFWSSCLYGKCFNFSTTSWSSCLYFLTKWVIFGNLFPPWLGHLKFLGDITCCQFRMGCLVANLDQSLHTGALTEG